MKPNPILAALVAVVLPSALLFAPEDTHDAKAAHANLYPPADIQWKDGPASLPRGAKIAVLEGDPTKEGMFLMRARLPDGYHIPAHTHPDANEWAYVLSGEWEESNITYTSGALFFAPKGVRHGPHVARTEVISLTIFDRPLTVV